MAGGFSGFILGLLAAALSYEIYREIQKRLQVQSPLTLTPGVRLRQRVLSNGKNFDDDDLQSEQLSRNKAFFGEAVMQALLKETFVIIVGCGGVGSHAAHALVRGGVGYVRLIDFDLVTLSSLNRAPMAIRSDVGKEKVKVVKEQLEMIAPWVHVEAVVSLFDADSAATLLSIPLPKRVAPTKDSSACYKYIYVLDCIDHVPTKIDLLSYCAEHQFKVVSSMGAGCKLDATAVRLCPLRKTKEDSLARIIRQKMKRLGKGSDIMVVYSEERSNGHSLVAPKMDPKTALPPSSCDSNAFNYEEYSSKADLANPLAILPTFRSRILPVLGTLPAIFGMTMATHVMTCIYAHETQRKEEILSCTI